MSRERLKGVRAGSCYSSVLALRMGYAIINGMNLKIDKAGRIVLPKNIRDRLRLRAGSSLKIEERPEGLVLRPTGRRPSMIQKDGLWVHLGKLPRDADWDRLIDDRDEHLKDILRSLPTDR